MKTILRISIKYLSGVSCLLLLTASACLGATYYVSPTGNDSTGTGGASAPWKTIKYATTQISGRDTLVLKSGTYYTTSNSACENIISPPSGTSSAYTTVKAEEGFGATIDGQNFTEYTSCPYPLYLNGKSYVRIEGIRIANGSADSAIKIDNSSYIKVLRTSVWNGVRHDADYGNVVVISSGSHHVLLEDVWVTGAMRYGVQVSSSDASGTNKIILRRVVVRWDYTASNQPKAAFSFYGSIPPLTDPTVQDVVCQNCVAIDTNPGTTYYAQYGGFINNKYTKNNKYYGSIAVNIIASGTDTISTGFHLGSNESDLTTGNEVRNSLVWDVSGNGIIFYGGDPSGTTLVDGVTVGNASRGVSNSGDTQFTVKNSLFYNTTNANSNIATSDYNWYSNPSQSQGTNYITTSVNLSRITETTDTGTGEGGVKRGAEIKYRYGVSETLWDETGFDQLTTVPLFPWPYEAQIKADFSATNDPPSGSYPATNDTRRGFCADGMRLSTYLQNYLNKANIGSWPTAPSPATIR
jgi:hypothetical protein